MYLQSQVNFLVQSTIICVKSVGVGMPARHEWWKYMWCFFFVVGQGRLRLLFGVAHIAIGIDVTRRKQHILLYMLIYINIICVCVSISYTFDRRELGASRRKPRCFFLRTISKSNWTPFALRQNPICWGNVLTGWTFIIIIIHIMMCEVFVMRDER